MTTITFRESLKYGVRLFALWLAIGIVGGGMAVLGGYLAVPEVRSLGASGTGAVETATLAGGLVLAFIGASSLIIGNFALVYKFLADSVSTGIRATSTQTLDRAAEVASESSEEATDSSPEQSTEPSESEEDATPASPEDLQGPAQVPASEQPTAETVRQPATHEGGQPTPREADTGSGEPADPDQSAATPAPQESSADQSPSEEPSPGSTATQEPGADQDRPATESTKRERTAEEIAFGAGSSGGEATEETTPVHDDEWFAGDADGESASETDRGAEMFEEESAEEVDSTDIETANDSSADPLSDQFDE